MNRSGILLMVGLVALSQADEPPPVTSASSPRPAPTGAMPQPAAMAGRPRQVAVGTEASGGPSPTDPKPAADASDAATRYTAEAKWIMAGYNNDEIVYAVTVTSLDNRTLRCITDVSGYYFDQDKKRMKITDRQVTTVFPSQHTPAGTWLDMDQASGASFSVKCRPVA